MAATAAVLIDKNHPGRIFEVIHGQLGAWPQGSAFSEYEFRRIHPAPKQQHPDDDLVEPEDYYAKAFERLLRPDGARPAIIREVADRKPDPTPLGPEANPPKAYKDPFVAKMAKELQEQSGGRK